MAPLRELDTNATIRATERLKEATAEVQRLVAIDQINANANVDSNSKPTPMASAGQRFLGSSGYANEKENDNISINSDEPFETKYNCNQIRTRINTFVNNGGMTAGELQDKLRVSSRSYQSFMKQSGPHAGVKSDVYAAAHQFFVARERAGLKMPRAKKTTSTSTTSAGAGDTTKTKTNAKDKDKDQRFAITTDTARLDGEEAGTVPVYDTCDDVRRKINTHLRRGGVTQASFSRELSKCVPGSEGAVTSRNVGDFLKKKGRMAGNTSKAFYAAYVYFEKMRLVEKKPKSKRRMDMEAEHGAKGVNLERDMGPNARLCLFSGESARVNKHGKYELTSPNGRTRVMDN